MATNAPPSRKTHVIRILGTNKKGEILRDIWADVERIDKSTSIDVSNGVRQRLVRKFRWRDDPAKPDEYLDPDLEDRLPLNTLKRITVLVKVCDPAAEDINDPDEWIPIRKIKRINSKTTSQKNNAAQLQYEKLINDDLQHSRVVEVRRIVHYDTNIDDAADKAFDEDPTLKAYVVKGEDYTRKDGRDGGDDTKDIDQWVEHEIVTKVIHKGNSVYYGNGNDPGAPGGTLGGQARKTKFLNQYLIDESEPAKLEKLGLNDIDPPYRLDPFQNIVNINLTPVQEVMAAWGSEFYATTTTTQNTKDGITYVDGFGGNVTTAASGLGVTVVPSAPDMVVYGKPRDGAGCFIKITPSADGDGDRSIRRGISDGNGGITWSAVKSVSEDSGPVAVSFAGAAFFVASNDRDSKSFLYVSFDGTTWSRVVTASNPNGGEDGINGHPEGNHVAFNPDTKVYCHTGWFSRAYQYDLIDVDDGRHHTAHAASVNFWSATSRDGLSWSPKYNMSAFYSGGGSPATHTGDQGAPGSLYNSIAYGAGVFVVPSVWAIEYDFFNFGGVLNVNNHVISRIDTCGVAVSKDGVNWTNMQLPGVDWDPGVIVFDPHGSADGNRSQINGLNTGIVFCKTGGPDPATKKPKGFFLVTGTEVSTGSEGSKVVKKIYHKKRWISSDGYSWRLAFATDDQAQPADNALSVHSRQHGKVIAG